MAHVADESPKLFGIVAEFDDPDALVAAATKARVAGYKKFDAYSPMPIHGLAEAMHFEDIRIPWMAFFGGITGCCLGMGFQAWIALIDYPMNVGGKPLFTWPQFIPITFEATVLVTGLTTFVSQFALNGRSLTTRCSTQRTSIVQVKIDSSCALKPGILSLMKRL
jgi:Protein of unknown function (DUF3341)